MKMLSKDVIKVLWSHQIQRKRVYNTWADSHPNSCIFLRPKYYIGFAKGGLKFTVAISGSILLFIEFLEHIWLDNIRYFRFVDTTPCINFLFFLYSFLSCTFFFAMTFNTSVEHNSYIAKLSRKNNVANTQKPPRQEPPSSSRAICMEDIIPISKRVSRNNSKTATT